MTNRRSNIDIAVDAFLNKGARLEDIMVENKKVFLRTGRDNTDAANDAIDGWLKKNAG